jgi:plastocyanin
VKLKTILIRSGVLILALVASAATPAAADPTTVTLLVEEGGFSPAEVEAPADARLRVEVTNHTAAATEFESFDLNRERVAQPGQTVTLYLSGLAPGRYDFFEDFHQARRGTLVVK